MSLLAEILLAFFAAVGIWTLGRMALDWLFYDKKIPSNAWAVLRAYGDGNELEQSLRKLSRLQQIQGVILADCGLTEQGRSIANELTEQSSNVLICPWSELGAWTKEAEEWTKQDSTTK